MHACLPACSGTKEEKGGEGPVAWPSPPLVGDLSLSLLPSLPVSFVKERLHPKTKTSKKFFLENCKEKKIPYCFQDKALTFQSIWPLPTFPLPAPSHIFSNQFFKCQVFTTNILCHVFLLWAGILSSVLPRLASQISAYVLHLEQLLLPCASIASLSVAPSMGMLYIYHSACHSIVCLNYLFTISILLD